MGIGEPNEYEITDRTGEREREAEGKRHSQ